MEHLRKLVTYWKGKEVPGVPRASEDLFKHLEDTLLPQLLRVLKKEDSLFAEVELFPGIKVPWTGSDEEWKLVHMALLYSVLHGDPKEKFGTLLDTVKKLLPGFGESTETDEITKILEDEETKSSLSEMLELIMSTRLVSLVGDIIQNISLDDLNLNLENPESLLEMLRNPQEHEGLKELMDRARMILEDRIKTGKLNTDDLRRDIEMIRAKFQSSFGKYLNEAILGDDGTERTGNTAQQILSNHPDARRARMMARLQKRQQQKVRPSK
jgi:hypothetical protein